MIRTKSEDAVSPVIGVMLLLVVTIIIAAVVAVFASGVGADAEPAPATVLNVADISDGYGAVSDTWVPKAGIELLEGDLPEGLIREISFMEIEGEEMLSELKITTQDGRLVYSIAILDETETFGNTEYNEQLFDKVEGTESFTDTVTLTINCVSGDTLNLEKVSVNVYDSEGTLIAEKNSFPGTISAGDTRKLTLDEIDGGVVKGNKVEVVILYGDHVIVSKELKVTRG